MQKPLALCTVLSFSIRRHSQTHLFTWTSALDHGHTFLRHILHSINHVCNQSGKIPNLSLNGDTEQSFKRATVSILENHMFLSCIREREVGGGTQSITITRKLKKLRLIHCNNYTSSKDPSFGRAVLLTKKTLCRMHNKCEHNRAWRLRYN